MVLKLSLKSKSILYRSFLLTVKCIEGACILKVFLIVPKGMEYKKTRDLATYVPAKTRDIEYE